MFKLKSFTGISFPDGQPNQRTWHIGNKHTTGGEAWAQEKEKGRAIAQ
jgi:hypothetical protein